MTVGLVIVSHSARLAAGVAELAEQMVQGKIPIVPAGGTIDDALGTSVERIMAAIQSADSPDGVLVLLDLGSAILSTEMALEMLDDEQQKRVSLSFAPLVEGAVAAALEASLGHTLREVRQAAEKTASTRQLQMLKPLAGTEILPDSEVPPTLATSISEDEKSVSPTREVQLLLTNPTGLHARPASLFVQTAARFQAKIQAAARGREANATSIMEVLSLGARQTDTITLRASGPEAGAALEALSELVRANFHETPSEIEAPASSPSVDTASQTPTSIPRAATEPWRGVTTSAGVALAPAFLYTSGTLALNKVERRSIAEDQAAVEQERLSQALLIAAQELNALATNMQSTVGQAQAAIFEAQALMLRDPTLLEAARQLIVTQHISAASALATTGANQASALENVGDPLIAARAVDVRDAVSRALQQLGEKGASGQDLSTLDHPVILLARDLTPSDTASLRPATVRGICTTQGGPTAHAAILARALGIPAIAGLNEAVLQIVHPGDEMGLDADHGLLYHQPTVEIRARLTQRAEEGQRQRAALKRAAQQAQGPLLVNGRRIRLLANIGSETEAEAAQQWGAEGIGLLRTEFLFASATTLPGEDEQCQNYIRVFRAFAGNLPDRAGPIVVRTLDAGADKPLPALEDILGPLQEENPALGLRGIRIHLAHPGLLEQQLSALLRAAAETGIQLHIMFPMITTLEELREARSIFERVSERLRSQGIAIPAHVPVGIMVEVPAAAVMAPELAELADFFSIGSNDLLQYTLACDRTNSSLGNLYHPMQPAVLRLIRQVAEAGRRAGKAVAVCGEIAGDIRLAPLLVGSGVDELSMTPAAIPAVRAAIGRGSSAELADLAARVSHLKTVAEVEQACSEFQLAHEKE